MLNYRVAYRMRIGKRLRQGELLPLPDPTLTASDAYTIETITLLPSDDNRVAVQVGA
jgi:hypothetical protein